VGDRLLVVVCSANERVRINNGNGRQTGTAYILDNDVTFHAVLFDLDGLLVDSTAQIERAWREWAIEHALDPDEVSRLSHGRRSADHIRLVAPHLDSNVEAVLLERREAEMANTLAPLPGAVSLYHSVPPAFRAVVTSGSRRLASARLQGAGLVAPHVLITADDVAVGKPDPEGYLHAAHRLKVAPAEALVLEDAPAGITAGKAAGMRVLAVTTTHPPEALAAADAVVDSLESVSIIAKGVDLELHLAGRSESLMTKHEVVRILQNAGLAQAAEEAQQSLPDEVDLEQAAEFGARYGITRDELISRMGGSP
jgi:sugar-phosphatase